MSDYSPIKAVLSGWPFSDPAWVFERLQQRMQIRDPERARRSPVAVYYYLFDVLELDGDDETPS